VSTTDITTLGMAVDTTGLAKANAALGRFTQATDEAAKSVSKMEGTTQSASTSLSSMRSILAGMALGATAIELIKMADAMTLMDARLKIVVEGSDKFAQAQNDIYRIAQKSNVGLSEATALYTKLYTPVSRLGGGVKETSAIVEAFSAALRVGGASTQEAASATLQFAQAMGSGKLQGDEFRAIAEASPRIMKALADGMGVPIEQLKKMGSEGKLTADIVGNALMKSLGQLRTEMAQIPDTVGGAMTRLTNDFKLAVSDINKTANLTLGLVGGIEEARKLLPTLKEEVIGVFKSMDDWVKVNKDELGAVWDVVKLTVGEIWEGVKALGSFFGFVAEVAVQSGALKDAWQVVRFLVAGVKDGVEIIGAALALVGSKVMQFLVAPLLSGAKLAATIAGLFDEDLAQSMQDFIDGIKTAATAGEAYADGVFQKFADGKTAVYDTAAAMDKAAKNAEQMQAALATSGVTTADTAREMRNFNRQADANSATVKTLKNAHAELTDEQKRHLASYKEMEAGLLTHLEELQAEIDGTGKLNEAEKAAIKFKNELKDKLKWLSADQREHINALLDEWSARIKLRDINKEQADAEEDAFKHRMKLWEQGEHDVEQSRKQIQQQRDHNDTLRYTKLQLAELESARLDDAIAAARQAVALDDLTLICNAETVAHKETLAALLDLKAAREEGVILQSAHDAADAWKNTAKDIEGWLTQAFETAFHSGEGFWKSLWKQIKSAFANTVLKLMVSASVDWAGAVLGLTSGASTTGTIGSAGGAVSGLQTLWSGATGAYSAATGYSGWVNSGAAFLGAGQTGGAATGSLAYANTVSAAGGDGLGAFIAGNGSWGGVSASAGSGGAAAATNPALIESLAGTSGYGASSAGAGGAAAGGGSAGWGAIAGWGALVVVGMAIGNYLYNKGYTGSDKMGSDGTSGRLYDVSFEKQKTKLLRALGVNDKWAEILGGGVRMNKMLDDVGLIKTPHVGGYALATAGGVQDITKQQGGIQDATTQEAVSGFSEAVLKMIGGFAARFGKDSAVAGVRAVFESDNNDPSWGLFHLLDKSGNKLGGSFDALGTLPSKPGEGFKKYTDMAAGGIVDALTELDLPKWVKDQLGKLDRTTLTMDGLADALTQIDAVQTAIDFAAGQFKDLGGVFAKLDVASSDAKYSIIQLLGGLDQFNAKTADYIGNFYSTQEQTGLVLGGISDQLDSVGLALPKTREEFRALVDSLDLNTESGQRAFNVLMGVQGAFAAVVPASEQVQAAVDDQTGATQSAASAMSDYASTVSSTAATVVDAWKGVTDSLINEVNRLRGVMGKDSPKEALANLQAKFAIDAARARAGDAEAAKRLVGWSQQIETMSTGAATNRYQANYARAGLASTLEGIVYAQGAGAGLANEVTRMRADVVAEIRRAAVSQNRAADTIRRATDGDALRTRVAT